MSGVVCKQVLTKQPAESLLYGVSFAPLLDSGETISSVTSVTEATGDLTIASEAVNAATFTDIDGNTVAIGEGVQFRVSGGTDGEQYRLEIIVATSSSNTREVDCLLNVRD